jgi:hypothetical protein
MKVFPFLILLNLICANLWSAKGPEPVQLLIENFQTNTLVHGLSQASQMEAFVHGMAELEMDSEHLKTFLIDRIGHSRFEEIQSTFRSHKNDNQTDQGELEHAIGKALLTIIKQDSKTGAYFLGCGASLGIGIPLLLASATFSVLSILNANYTFEDALGNYMKKMDQYNFDYDQYINETDKRLSFLETKLDIKKYEKEFHRLTHQKNQYISKWNKKVGKLEAKYGLYDDDQTGAFIAHALNKNAQAPWQKATAIVTGALSVYPLINAAIICGGNPKSASR